MKIIQYIFLFFLIFPSIGRPCAGMFSRSKAQAKTTKTRKFIQDIFSNPAHVTTYQGQEGYVRFVEQYYKHLRMDTVYNKVRAVLSKQKFKALSWKMYQGYIDEFQAERDRILDEHPK